MLSNHSTPTHVNMHSRAQEYFINVFQSKVQSERTDIDTQEKKNLLFLLRYRPASGLDK